MERERGIVHWFSPSKGYGFIKRPNKPDVFFHWSCIQMEGYKQTKEGDEVEFEVVKGEKGAQASDLVVIRAAEVQR